MQNPNDVLLKKLEEVFLSITSNQVKNLDLPLIDALKSDRTSIRTMAKNAVRDQGMALDSYVASDARFFGDTELLLRGDGYATFFYPRGIGSVLLQRCVELS